MGRCAVSRRPEVAIRAGTLIRVRRMVPVVAFVNLPPAMVPAARVRLKASHANQPGCVGGEPPGRQVRQDGMLHVACTFSIIARCRCVLSAVTVLAWSAGVVVKNAWNRHTSNKLG